MLILESTLQLLVGFTINNIHSHNVVCKYAELFFGGGGGGRGAYKHLCNTRGFQVKLT